nr:DUF3856 domain-containing protein [Polycladospora coralii]
MRLVSLDDGLHETLQESEFWKELESTVYYLKGRNYSGNKKFDLAIEMYKKAIEIEEEVFDTTIRTDSECDKNLNIVAACHTALARIYNMKHKLNEAIIEVDKGIKCFNQSGERKYLYSHLWITKAIVLTRIDRDHEALGKQRFSISC